MTFSTRREAFRVDAYARGLDHTRTQFVQAYGDLVANPSATFSAGMLVSLDSSGYVVPCTGTNPFGVVKYNKNTSFYASVVGEYIQLNGTDPTNLAHANLWAAVPGTSGGVHVSTTLNGTAKSEGSGNDYTVNYTNGTITRGSGTTISDGGYVYVNYQYQLTAAQLNFDGHNFWNFDDDVTVQGGKVTVITGDAIVYTTAFDPSATWVINAAVTAGATGNGKAGLFTIGGGGAAGGICVQVPTPDDPFVGIKLSF